MTEQLSSVKRQLLEELRARRAATAATATDSLVRLRDGAPDSAPIVLVHPIGGGVFCYAELARLVPGRRPVWAIAADGLLSGDSAPTVTEIAEHYRAQLAARGIPEPAVLAGWSFGGLVAYEMARLPAAGTPVVLIDTAPWPSDVPMWTAQETLTEFVEDLLLSDGTPMDRIPAIATVAAGPTPDVLTAVSAELRAAGIELKLSPADLAERLRVFTNATRAMQRHRPGNHDAPAVLLHAAHSDADPRFWAERSTGTPLRSVGLPGDHFAVLRRPNVARVADALYETGSSPGQENA
jgi:thioesterase domain-containing protein